MDVPLLTPDEINRVVKAGHQVWCHTPSGVRARVLEAGVGWPSTQAGAALAPGGLLGPDLAPDVVLRVKVLYGLGVDGRRVVGWCVPRGVWAEEPVTS